SVNRMSQAAVETPAAIALKEYFGLESDDSDESVVGSPERQNPVNAGEIIKDAHDCLSSKSSSGVSESSFSSPDSTEVSTTKRQRRPPATRISTSDKNSFEIASLGSFVTAQELFAGGGDFSDGSVDSDEEERLLNESADEASGNLEDDLGFHEVSPPKRKRIEIKDGLPDNSLEVSPKRARFDLVEIVETVEEEEIEDARDSSALSENGSEGGLSPHIFAVHKRVVHEEVREKELSPSFDEEEDNLFDVGGVEWNFSSRCAEYLTSAVFVNDIYKVICSRENGCHPESVQIRPEDVDDALRKEFIDTLLARRDALKLTLTSVHLSLRLLDRFLLDHMCDRKALVGVCIVAVVLASKMEEYESCRFSRVARVIFPFEEEVEVTTLKKLESTLYSVFNFDIDIPTPFIAANILHTMVVSTKQQVHLANYLLELSMLDWSISQHRPTVLAHAVVSLSHAIAKESTGNSMKFLSDVDSLLSVERRLAPFSKMTHSRPLGFKLIHLFQTAAEDAVSIYDRYCTESELYVAFFEVTESLKNALANG
ncbi:hypothetical protein PMAYCL1PPCAC_23479, partial [Pristionchus mayeri]